jgi:WD40 repeat protein
MHELTECGEITCAIAPNSRTLITGSTNTVINVWQLNKGNSRCAHVLRLRKSLYGHTDAISCLAVSVSYG